MLARRTNPPKNNRSTRKMLFIKGKYINGVVRDGCFFCFGGGRLHKLGYNIVPRYKQA